MGEIIELDKSNIKTIQWALKSQNVNRFLKSYLKNPNKVLVPVRKDSIDSQAILLDGHSRSVIISTLSGIKEIPLYGYVANHEWDFLKVLPNGFWNDPDMLEDLNYFISQNFSNPPGLKYSLNLDKFKNELNYFSSPEKLLTSFFTFYEFEKFKLDNPNSLIEKIKIDSYKFDNLANLERYLYPRNLF